MWLILWIVVFCLSFVTGFAEISVLVLTRLSFVAVMLFFQVQSFSFKGARHCKRGGGERNCNFLTHDQETKLMYSLCLYPYHSCPNIFSIDWFIVFGSSTLLWSFWAWSVILSTHFLGRLPEWLTSTKFPLAFFRSNWQLPYLNQRYGKNDCRNYFMTKSQWKMVPDTRIEPATSWISVGRRIGRASDWPSGPGYFQY